MKAIVQDQYGSTDALALRDVDRPTPRAGEVLVGVHAASVHMGDWHLMTGKPYLLRFIGFGLRAPKVKLRGMDVAGTVVAVGDGVMRFHVGDEVFGTGDGSFAEYAVAREAHLANKPASLSFAEAAAIPTSAVSALQALRDRGEVQPGQHVLLVGASGGVGLFAVQIAKALGAQVTGVCSTGKMDLVTRLGADHVIDYTQEDFTKRGETYDLVLDLVGTHSLGQLRSVLRPRGTLVLAGGEGGNPWLGGIERWVQALLLSPFVGQKLRPLSSVPRQADLQFLKQLIEAGKVAPVIDRTYPLEETPEAIRYLRAGRAAGKIIIAVSPPAVTAS